MTGRLLFQPIRLGPLTLRNRIVFPPMTTGYEAQGRVTSRSRAFYRRIARGGSNATASWSPQERAAMALD